MTQKEEDKYCIKCLHKADEKDQYCIKCGTPLINRCADSKVKGKHCCGIKNSSDAAFCSKCGYETIFRQKGLI